MKIGRNDNCPCGSGVKYKKCCLDNGGKDNAASGSPIDFICSMTGLSLMPENHLNIRLFKHLIIEFLNSNFKDKILSYEEIIELIKIRESSNNLKYGPVGPFMDSVIFFGGDYKIFSGNHEKIGFILNSLLWSICSEKCESLPNQFKDNVKFVGAFLLGLSNLTANRLGYHRYQCKNDLNNRTIFPTEVHFNKLKESIVFNRKELNALLNNDSLTATIIEEFSFSREELSLLGGIFTLSRFVEKPLLIMGDEVVVPFPDLLGESLLYFIHEELWGQNCFMETNSVYLDLIWFKMQTRLTQMGFVPENIIELKVEEKLPIKQGIFRIDDDKIAFIQLCSDLSNLNVKSNHQRVLSELTDEINLYDKRVLSDILTLSAKNLTVLFLNLTPLTNSTIKEIPGYPAKIKYVEMEAYEFEILSRFHDINAIDLWSYGVYSEGMHLNVQNFEIRFLSRFIDFKNLIKKFSETPLESEFYNYQFPSKYFQLINSANTLLDRHSVNKLVDGQLINCAVELFDPMIPLYTVSPEFSRPGIELFVSGYFQPLWVTIDISIIDGSDFLKNAYEQIGRAIAYWLWQIRDDVKPFLEPIKNPLSVKFELLEWKQFEDFNGEYIRDSQLFEKFTTTSDLDSVFISLPPELFSFLYGADNFGERNLVEHLIIAINKLIVLNGLSPINQNLIPQIIDSRAPLGYKKKVWISDGRDSFLLSGKNLQKHQFISGYNRFVIKSQITTDLGSLCPPFGLIKSNVDKKELLTKIITEVLEPKLDSLLSNYDSIGLIQKLISLNDSLIYHREDTLVNAPVRIACYDNSEYIQYSLRNEREKSNQSIFAIRGLIERIVVCDKISGKAPSNIDIDELLAIMHEMINFGEIYDLINSNMYDYTMAVHPEGYIAFDRTIARAEFGTYSSIKHDEQIKDSINNYEKVFLQINKPMENSIPRELDKAFFDDYEVTLTSLFSFLRGLALVGRVQSNSYASEKLDNLRLEINKQIGEHFSQNDFDRAVSFFALPCRIRFNSIPEGYKKVDIEPWNFNRQLSHILKPLVVVQEVDSSAKIAFWGIRHVVLSIGYIMGQIETHKFKGTPRGQVNKVLGQMAKNKGESFEKDIMIKEISNKINVDQKLIIRPSVKIGPKASFHCKEALGDIDIFIIDKLNQVIISIECKFISTSRNVRGMAGEIVKILGKAGNEWEKPIVGYLDKHMKRHDWLLKNRLRIAKEYGEDILGFEVKSIFITREGLATPHLRKGQVKIPFITQYDIEERGYSAILDSRAQS